MYQLAMSVMWLLNTQHVPGFWWKISDFGMGMKEGSYILCPAW
jgi:hypothetical protein